MLNYVIDGFKLYYPNFYNKAIDIYESGPYEITVRLNDGSFISYYDLDNTFRPLPEDPNSMTEREYRRDFAIRLSRLMYEKDITQEELSELIGVSQSTISSYITGRKSPSFYIVDKIAKALKCDINRLRYIYE